MRLPPDYPASFYGLQAPPPITGIWIASYDLSGGRAESFKRGSMPNGWSTGPQLTLPTGTVRPEVLNGYRITINVWHLVFKVDVLEPPADWTQRNRIQISLSREIPGVTQIWPMTEVRFINWPLQPVLDDVGMNALANAGPIVR
jgi:hypothetical protein